MAGGGSFLTFPALLLTGLDPHSAFLDQERSSFDRIAGDVARTVSVKINGRLVLENATLPAHVELDRVTAAAEYLLELRRSKQPVAALPYQRPVRDLRRPLRAG